MYASACALSIVMPPFARFAFAFVCIVGQNPKRLVYFIKMREKIFGRPPPVGNLPNPCANRGLLYSRTDQSP